MYSSPLTIKPHVLTSVWLKFQKPYFQRYNFFKLYNFFQRYNFFKIQTIFSKTKNTYFLYKLCQKQKTKTTLNHKLLHIFGTQTVPSVVKRISWEVSLCIGMKLYICPVHSS